MGYVVRTRRYKGCHLGITLPKIRAFQGMKTAKLGTDVMFKNDAKW